MANIQINLNNQVKKIKPMHAGGQPPVTSDASDRYFHYLTEAGIPYSRLHDVNGAFGGYKYVDIPNIFRDFSADVEDPESYDFSVTDSYVEAAMLAGAKIIFRLGESIDLISGIKRDIPESVETLTRVCVNIIRHYNEGWAKGYTFGIEYFDIWNFCDENKSEALELYRSLANSIKLYDENIKLGGMSFPLFGGAVRDFLRYCKKNRVHLDFVSVDCFASDPDEVGAAVEGLIMLMRNLGLDETELVVGKWCYADSDALEGSTLELVVGGSRGEQKRRLFESQSGVKGAAFASAFMLRLMNSELRTACFYDAQPLVSPFCAIADRFGKERKPYYAFKSFGELYRARNSVWVESQQTDGMAHTGIYAGAAVSDDGKGYIMLSSFKGCGVIDLRIDGLSSDVYTADIYMLDGVKDMALADSVPVSGMKKRLLLNVSEYGVIMIKLY